MSAPLLFFKSADPRPLLQEAIEHLEDDAQQDDLPPEEQEEDQALVARLKEGLKEPIRKAAPVLIFAKAHIKGHARHLKNGKVAFVAAHEDGRAAHGEQEHGPFGPIFRQFRHDAQGAIAHLKQVQTGEAVAALHHPEVGDIDLVWGREGTQDKDYENGYGLAKIGVKHPEVMDDLQGVLDTLSEDKDKSTDSYRILVSADHKAIVRMDWDRRAKTWLLTAYADTREKESTGAGTRAGAAQLDEATRASAGGSESIAPSSPLGKAFAARPGQAPILLFLKATPGGGQDSIKNHPGFVLYGHPPRWHKYNPAEHHDPSKIHAHVKKTYHVEAAKELADQHNAKSEAGELTAAEMAAQVEATAQQKQAVATAKANVVKWKQALKAGQKPTKGQHQALLNLADSDPAKAEAIIKDVVASIGSDKYLELTGLAGASGTPAKDAAPKADAKPAPAEEEKAKKAKKEGKEENPAVDPPTAQEPTPEPAAETPPASAASGLTPVQQKLLGELGKLHVAETNTNYKVVAKKVAKLQALIEAGDVEGLKAATWGSNKYALKIAQMAQVAAHELASEQAAAPQPQAAEAAPKAQAAAEPPPAADAPPSDAKAEEAAATAPADPPDPTAAPTFDGWKAAMIAGQVPTYEQEKAVLGEGEAEAKAKWEVIYQIGINQFKDLTSHVPPTLDQALQAGAKPEDALNALYPPGANGKTPKEGDTKTVNGVTYVLENGRWHRASPKEQGQQQTGAAQDDPTAAPTLDGWKAALIAGKVPTNEQQLAAMAAESKQYHKAYLEAAQHNQGSPSISDLIQQAQAAVEKAQAGTSAAAPAAADWTPGFLADLDASKLPDTNTNAKAVNAKIDKLKAMIQAGDWDGIKAAQWGSNNYGKKLAKQAAAALAHAGQGTPVLFVKPAAETSAATSEPTAAPTESEDPTRAPTLDGWKAALIANKVPTPEQHAAAMAAESKQYHLAYLEAAQQNPHVSDLVQQAVKAAESPEPEPEPTAHPLDAIPVPDWASLGASEYQVGKVNAALALFKQKLKDGDVSVLNGATKHLSKTGKYIVVLPNPDMQPNGTLKATGYGALHMALYAHVQDLKEAAGKPPKAKKTPAPKTTTAPASDPAISEPIDHWTEQPGTQKGSNPGGLYTDDAGQKWYVKFPKSADHVQNELLASKLYAAAGVLAPELKVIAKGGKIGIASKWKDGLSKVGAGIKNAEGALDGFAVDAWLANHDAVGMGYDNLLKDKNDQAVRIDVGGALLFRAQGSPKAQFGETVTELQTMLDPAVNSDSAAVYGGITEDQIKAGVAKIAAIKPDQIKAMVEKYGPGDAAAKQALADKLIARRADLLKQYPVASSAAQAQAAPTFDPDKLSAPPNFLNWGGSGKPGPSSVLAVNQANHDATQATHAAAQTGDIKAIEAVTGAVVDKTTGATTGTVPVLQHPSQHIKGFAQQMINEIRAQLNPPKPLEVPEGHPITFLDQAHAVVKNIAAETVKRIGKFLQLGKPGVASSVSDILTAPKMTYQSGALSAKTYAATAKAVAQKIPLTQMQAIKAYTGSGYAAINHSLWQGNPSGAALAAAQALHTHGHEITEGTVLGRKFNLHGDTLQQFINSVGSVLQEPAVVSTSISPHVFSGNVHLKMHVGPGVKGLYVGKGSSPSGGAISHYSGEKEVLLPPNTRMYIVSVKPSPPGGDEDGFGSGSSYIAEVIVLPTRD